MSERTSSADFSNCSGLANAGVPTKPSCVRCIVSAGALSNLAKPKSMIFTLGTAVCAVPPSSSSGEMSIKFAGFRSRWIRLRFSAAANAEQTWSAISIVVRAPNAFLQRLALDQFHGVKELPCVLGDSELEHRGDVLVSQRGGSARFA